MGVIIKAPQYGVKKAPMVQYSMEEMKFHKRWSFLSKRSPASLFTGVVVPSPCHGNRPYRTSVRPNHSLYTPHYRDTASAARFEHGRCFWRRQLQCCVSYTPRCRTLLVSVLNRCLHTFCSVCVFEPHYLGVSDASDFLSNSAQGVRFPVQYI